jgi:hypothetical protein
MRRVGIEPTTYHVKKWQRGAVTPLLARVSAGNLRRFQENGREILLPTRHQSVTSSVSRPTYGHDARGAA